MSSRTRWLVLSLALAMPVAAHAISWQSIIQWFLNLNNENSGWAVVTKQTAVASNQIVSNEMRANQMLAVSMRSIQQTERAKEAVINYSAAFGQPESNLCGALAENAAMVKTMENQQQDARERMANFSNRQVGTPVEYKQAMQAAHAGMYCSISESKQGLCKLQPNGMQAWDSDYSGFAMQNSLVGKAELGAIAYVNTLGSMLPQPDPRIDCKSTGCSQAKIENMSNLSRASMVTNSVLSQVSIRVNPNP